MKTWCEIFALNGLFALGCGQGHPDTPPIVVGQRVVTVFGDDPIVDMNDGTRIGVDGVPSGQSMKVQLTHSRGSNGTVMASVDAVDEAMPKPDQP
jgi:hypothetical protein